MDRATGESTQSLKTIVVAEDDPSSRELVCEILEAQGYHVVETCNGPDALEKIQELIPDLVLMDIQMSVINGYEATRQIRQFNDKVIIIAQTAYGLAGDREKAIEAGCNDYVSKPLNLALLKRLVKKYFNRTE